ncbi:MAG: peptidylprolyl isomerase [Xanthomonadaceae bacterium]|nr:peptidylprolyl isomerase [Xanthomonadaceae bacterium]MDE1958566.1 peptidylprolyl isomerase [Xanthomonadaceae bacterium]MDE2177703.1 peptidylprolyl isomerase [Xanthomonadaceae bacterium]MDE2246171.1 peptidylprolyl isomerase [Xanthomonadaceae bacterium]
MKAGKDAVVRIHYTLSDATGLAIESSRERGEPVAVLLGRGGLIAGVERALEGRAAGEQFSVTVAAEDAYGPRREDAIQRVPKKYFQRPDRLKPGMVTTLALKDGGRQTVMVRKVGMTTIDVDTNHPLAGRELSFDIEIVEVRAAQPEELAHGHAHGPQGHPHAD